MILPDMYCNAGGVTVSYFEWLKNLSHVRFGRMEKRFEERTSRRLLAAMQAMTGKSLTELEIATIAAGPSEEDLVNSGLEETMVTSYQKIRDMRGSFASRAPPWRYGPVLFTRGPSAAQAVLAGAETPAGGGPAVADPLWAPVIARGARAR